MRSFLSVIQVVENVTFNSIEQRVIDYLKWEIVENDTINYNNSRPD